MYHWNRQVSAPEETEAVRVRTATLLPRKPVSAGMNISTLVLMACVFLSAWACSSASTTPDSPPLDSTVPDSTVPAVEITYHQDIQPIVKEHCGHCHEGCSPDTCAGNTCFATYYEAMLFEAPVCGNSMNVAECGLYRIEFSKNADAPEHLKLQGPKGTIVLPDDQINTIRAWINSGMAIGTPPPPVPASCVPDCTGKECGCDGCGGLCENTCSSKYICQHSSGTCSILSTCDQETGLCEGNPEDEDENEYKE